jgi:hypothetical protein
VPVAAGGVDGGASPSAIVSVAGALARGAASSRPPNGSPSSSTKAITTTPMITSGTIHQ